MKIVLKYLLYNIACIFLFALLYHYLGDDNFKRDDKKRIEWLDCLFLSTTVQASVGYSDLTPTSDLSKMILIFQQFLMISSNVFVLYIFTS
jgi:hypothetical protein